DSTITSKAPQPFAEPLRSRTSKSLMYLVSFFLALLIVTIVHYGYKIQVDNANLWPLQNFVEISLLILVAMLAVYTFTMMEKKIRHQTTDFSSIVNTLETPRSLQSFASDVHTFRDLIAEYHVVVGQRADTSELMQKVYSGHQQFVATHPKATELGNPTVGVFISGPDELKQAMENAITSIGASHFDVFEEEFEL
ncbi:hypothetical protein BBJ28_00020153, partial [Nothophytophthora sp. Chile5]